MYPNGYNLSSGGLSSILNESSRMKISNSLKIYFSDVNNRKRQSEIQKSITFRSVYSRKNILIMENIPNPLPKYIYYVNRKDGRKGFSCKCYKTGKRKYFTSKNDLLYDLYMKANNYLYRN